MNSGMVVACLGQVLAREAEMEAAHPETKGALGGALYSERMGRLARAACAARPGDILELVVLSGTTSVRLAAVARALGRRLACVDNWRPGTEYRLEEVEAAFLNSIHQWTDVVDVWKMDAHTDDARRLLRTRDWAFAMSDDGHRFEDHQHELESILPRCRAIVVVDDYYYAPEVPDAVADALKRHPDWIPLRDERLREVWLVRKAATDATA